MRAFIFGGQGSQAEGMGYDFYNNSAVFKEYFDSIKLDFDIKKLAFEGSADDIKKTRYAQPLIGAYQAAVAKMLKHKGIMPDVVCGLSLGEYNALVQAGAIHEEDLLPLLSFRGKSMEEASAGIKTKMLAVLGMAFDDIQQEVKKGEDGKFAVISNYNTEGQIVIAGEEYEVDELAERLAAKGAKRLIPLNVSGPFHTPYMIPAGERLGEYIDNIKLNDEKIPVYYNVLGNKNLDGIGLKKLLVDQISQTVLFKTCIDNMLAHGVKEFVEIAPKSVLKAFVKKINKDVKVTTICSYKEYLDYVEGGIE